MASIESYCKTYVEDELKKFIKTTIDICKTQFSSYMYHSDSLESDPEKADIILKIREKYFKFLVVLSELNDFELFKYLINNIELNNTCIHYFGYYYDLENSVRTIIKELLLHLCINVDSKYLLLLLESKIINNYIFPNKIILDTLLYTDNHEKLIDIKKYLNPELSIGYLMNMEESLSKTLIQWIISNKNNKNISDEMIEAVIELCQDTYFKVEKLYYYIKPEHILHEELELIKNNDDESIYIYSIMRQKDNPL